MSTEPTPDRRNVTILRREPGVRPALSALLQGRCPRCRRGRIFVSLWRMAPDCEVCGLRYEREPGYFTGAMYVSYLIALPIFIGMFVGMRYVFPALSFAAALAMTVLLFSPFVPFVFRTSRILWIHFDRTIDAEE
jgi:uncharacterized protein (DUF983 family)